MKSHTLKSVVLAILIMLAMVIACSDNSTDSNGKPEGDPDDAAFLAAKQVMDDADQVLRGAYIIMWIDFRKTTYAAPDPPEYHSSSGYWYNSDTQTDGTAIMTLVDSFRLWHGGTPVQYADSALLTKIEGGFHINGVNAPTFDTAITNHELTLIGAAGDVYAGENITGNSTGDYHVNEYSDIEGHAEIGTCLIRADLISESNDVMSLDIWDIVIDDSLPDDGNFTEAGMISITPLDPQYSVESGNPWSSNTAFEGGIILTTIYENTSNKWTVVDTIDTSK